MLFCLACDNLHVYGEPVAHKEEVKVQGVMVCHGLKSWTTDTHKNNSDKMHIGYFYSVLNTKKYAQSFALVLIFPHSPFLKGGYTLKEMGKKKKSETLIRWLNQSWEILAVVNKVV